LPAAIDSPPEIWKIHVSVALPEIVTSFPILTALVHLYKPGVKIRLPIAPLPRLVKFGFTLPVASVNAVPMSPMATVSVEGVGAEY